MTHLEQLRAERKQRLVRMTRHTVPDKPIEVLSASQRSGAFIRPPVFEDRPINPWELDKAAFVAWLKRQEEIHPLAMPPKEPWLLSIESETDPLQPRVEDIQKIVARAYGISRRELMSHRRLARLVLPRQIAMFLAKTMTKKSLPDVGRRFSYRDHTTILHAVRKIAGMIAEDSKLASTIKSIKEEIMALTIKRHADAEQQAMEGSAPRTSTPWPPRPPS